jgi:hypothetical protein
VDYNEDATIPHQAASKMLWQKQRKQLEDRKIIKLSTEGDDIAFSVTINVAIYDPGRLFIIIIIL